MSAFQQFGLRHPISRITTSGGTTTLINTSNAIQYFDGTSSQTVVLPDATTMKSGRGFYIANRSTGTITIKDNSTATLQLLPSNTDTWVNPIDVSTSVGVWDISQGLGGGGGGSGGAEVTAAYGLTTTQAVASNGIIKFDTLFVDTTLSYNTSTGEFTAPESGDYLVIASTQVVTAQSNSTVYVTVNGVNQGFMYLSFATVTNSGGIIIKALAGDLIALHCDTATQFLGNVPSANQICISKIGGANAVVTATIGLTSSVTPTVGTPVIYDTVITDTHKSYNVSNGLYLIPVTGSYEISVNVANTTGAGTIYVARNGTNIGYIVFSPPDGVTRTGSAIFPFSAGDTLAIQKDVTSTFVGNPTTQNTLSINLVGGAAQASARQVVNGSGTVVVNGLTQQLKDPSGNMMIDWLNAFMQDNAGVTSLIWGPSRQLVDTSSQTALDWSARQLVDPSNQAAIDWSTRSLLDSAGMNSMDFEDRQLLDTTGGNAILDFSTGFAPTINRSVVTNGFSFTLISNQSTTFLDAAGTLASGTVLMPASPADGQRMKVCFSNIVTSLTVSGNGNSIIGAPSTIAANGFFEMTFSSSGKWFRSG